MSVQELKWQTSVLAFEDGYMITHHKPVLIRDSIFSKLIVITFDNYLSGKRSVGFGTEFLRRRGIESIHVAQREKTGYQYLSLVEFTRIVAPVVEGKRVITYGSSLGGYAAIYFSSGINAKALSFSPRSTADPLVTGMHKGYREAAIPFLHLDLADPSLERSAVPPFVCYNPDNEIDGAFFREKIARCYPDAEVLEVRNLQHNVLTTIQSSGVLREFILALIGGDYDVEALGGLVNLESDVGYRARLAVMLLRKGDTASSVALLHDILRSGKVCSFEVVRAVREHVLKRKFRAERAFVLSGDVKKVVVRRFGGEIQSKTGKVSCLAMVDLHEHFLDFEAAYEVANFAKRLHPASESIVKRQRLLKKVGRYLGFLEKRE